MPGRNHLFVPGPTNVPDRVSRAMLVSMEDHRSPKVPELTLPIFEDLKKVFKTKTGQPFVFPASGTGGWESALQNTLNPGDKVLASRFGQFSHLWIDMCQRLGLDVQIIEVEWGKGAPPDEYEAALKADTNHEIKAVLVCQNETATGVTSDVGAIRRAMDTAKHPALLFVDGVSSIASIDFRMDEWGVDVAVSGSQKGFMLPAGLAIICASQKALEARKSNKLVRCFFDWNDMINTNATGYFPYTPSLPMLYGLRESLQILLRDEGLENVFARHHRLAQGVREAVKGWGLSLCAQPGFESDTVSAIRVPEGFNGADVIATAFHKYNMSLGAGLSKVAGKVFRIGHLGDLNEISVLGAIAGAEMAMRDVGIQIVPGSGVGAAVEYYRKASPVTQKVEGKPVVA